MKYIIPCIIIILSAISMGLAFGSNNLAAAFANMVAIGGWANVIVYKAQERK